MRPPMVTHTQSQINFAIPKYTYIDRFTCTSKRNCMNGYRCTKTWKKCGSLKKRTRWECLMLLEFQKGWEDWLEALIKKQIYSALLPRRRIMALFYQSSFALALIFFRKVYKGLVTQLYTSPEQSPSTCYFQPRSFTFRF